MIGWRSRKDEEDLNRDIEEHIALETQDNIDRGMSPEEARYAALRSFGNVMRVKEDVRCVWIWTSLELFCADVRHALRRIRRAPGTAALVMLSLAIAIGPSVALFSVMDLLLLTPVPVRAPEELVSVMTHDTRPNVAYPYASFTYPEYREFQRSLTSFSGSTYSARTEPTAVVNGRRTILSANLVSSNYFELMGIPVRLGPGFSEQRPGVVISNGLWARELGRRADVIGQTLLIAGQAFPIVGVADPAFQGMANINLVPRDVWIPIDLWFQLQPGSRSMIEDRRTGEIMARMRPGVSLARAATEVQTAFRQIRKTSDSSYLITETTSAFAERKKVTAFFAAIGVSVLGILLAVACANVAGILLAQAEERRSETAVRQALGAARIRLIREWMVESAMLATLGAAVGLAGARVLMSVLPRLLPAFPVPLHYELAMGARVWLYAIALMCISAISFGLVPAWRSSRPDLLSGLRRDSVVGLLNVRVPVRSLLMIAQVAAAVVLLFSAGLVLETLSAAGKLYPGFEPRRPVVVAMLAPGPESEGRGAMDTDALTLRLSQLGGVRSVTYGQTLPLMGSAGPRLRMELPGQEPREVLGGNAGPGYLSALGVHVLAGRDLQRSDQHSVMVNESLARMIDPAGNAVGRQVSLNGTLKQVVGVFQNAPWETIHDEPHPRAISLSSVRAWGVNLAIEVSGDPAVFLPTLRTELASAQPDAVLLSCKTLWQHYKDALFLERAMTALLYGIGVLAVLLAATGLHGIASALFARRSREFAIRLALGATPRQIMRLVLSASLKLTAWGIGLGLAIALPCALLIASKVHGFSPWSVPALGLSCGIVLFAAVAAAAEPVRRVVSLQPAEVLHRE